MSSRIPRHFHFIFGLREQTEPFHLVHYLCLESCLRVNRPDRVTLYYHYEPYGRYWNLIKHRIERVRVPLAPRVASQHYDDPLIGRKLRYAHHADFIRLEKLLEHGGVYADIDTLFVRPIPDALYEKPFVIGREDPVTDPRTGVVQDSLCNALMLAESGAAFARIWLERMPAAMDGSWSNHSCQLAERLRAEFPDLVHVEPSVSFYPYMWTRPALRALLEENHPLPPGALSIHLWAHMWWAADSNHFTTVNGDLLTRDYLSKSDTTYAQAARLFLPPPPGLARSLLAALSESVHRHLRRPLQPSVPLKTYSNLRVPWHTHLYRSVLALFVKSDRPWHVYFYRGVRSLLGDPKYSPPPLAKVIREALRETLPEILQATRSPRAPAELAAALVELGRLRNRTNKTVLRHVANLTTPSLAVRTSYAFNHITDSLQPVITERSGTIIVYTVAVGEDYRQSVAPCLASHVAYCEKHGYSHAELAAITIPRNRPVPWYKIPLGHHLLKLGYKHAFHIDADCLITNPDFKLESLAQKLDDPRTPGAMLITEDESGINSGCFLLRNTPDAVRLLDSIWLYDAEVDHANWEQEALKHLLADHEDFLALLAIEKNRKLFNSFPRERQKLHPSAINPVNVWTPGDFICHFSGIRPPLLGKMIARYTNELKTP